jgi:biotin carboxylase
MPKAAARELLRDGPVRIKSVLGIGGAGQHLVRTEEEIDAALAAIGDDELALAGVRDRGTPRGMPSPTAWAR